MSASWEAIAVIIRRPLHLLRISSVAVKALALECFVLALWVLPVWHLRFTWTEANFVFVWGLLLAVVVTATIVFENRFGKVIRYGLYGAATLLTLALVSLVVVSGVSLFSPVSGYEKVAEIRAGNSYYRAYLGNCGAVCSFNIEIRREFDIFSWLRLTSSIYEREPAERAFMSWTDRKTIRVQVGYGKDTIDVFEITP